MSIIDLAQRLFRQDSSSVPSDTRVYVTGDIHGRFDLLSRLQEKIEKNIISSSKISKIYQVYLGDYIDRGRQSREVIDFLLQPTQPGVERIFLKGNHEAVLLQFLENADVLTSWQNFGGLETLHSYGVDLNLLKKKDGYEEIRSQLAARLPEAHLEFFRNLQPSLTLGDYFFCHAGVRPGIALEDQKEEDLIWIREEFLINKAKYPKIIIHGHTPVEKPEIWKNRINIDTGAYITNNLTCLVLEKDSRKCI